MPRVYATPFEVRAGSALESAVSAGSAGSAALPAATIEVLRKSRLEVATATFIAAAAHSRLGEVQGAVGVGPTGVAVGVAMPKNMVMAVLPSLETQMLPAVSTAML